MASPKRLIERSHGMGAVPLERVLEPPIGGVHQEVLAGLRVLELDEPDGGQLYLPPITDADRDQIVRRPATANAFANPPDRKSETRKATALRFVTCVKYSSAAPMSVPRPLGR